MNNSTIIYLTDINFKTQININSFILVDFWADWCNPCKMFSLVLDEIFKKYNKKLFFAKLNIDKYPNIAQKYDVRSIPTIILFNNGIIIDQTTGSINKIQLTKFLDKHLK
ncbi:thioredoxin [Enterobacteriaceae endosymbiont of Plateumaris consimilis]|uniref:thioredoxin n=1 Tax=Enterobacteriaceae endosymbiont of Plateumaris consimilis TaxID=2675794 RepID=UPI00144925F1|nr:thioredoxin [Enterobacteriaceae endosymbiont of Plateumaris consimilis]QJC28656.1 thioredoxin [Enterobacteriaceae endosymbiont of Plateumaris consimilis]